MSMIIRYSLLIYASMLAASAMADVANGEALHEENCISCHMLPDHNALYTRSERKVDSLHRLGGQVSACTQTLNIAWFPDDERDVVEYLNMNYYKFAP